MRATMTGFGLVAALCISSVARADEPKNDESVARLRAAVADVRDSFAQIRQVVTVARGSRNPVSLNCAWRLQEKTADLLHNDLEALRAANTGQVSGDRVLQIMGASRDVANLEASAHLCLTSEEGVRAPAEMPHLPPGVLASVAGHEVLFRAAPDPIRGFAGVPQ